MEITQANICISDILMPAKIIKHAEHKDKDKDTNIHHTIQNTHNMHNIKASKPIHQKLNKPIKQESAIQLDNDTINSIRPTHNINYSNSKIAQLNNELKAGIYYHITKDLRKLY
jgi:hypothetical protein